MRCFFVVGALVVGVLFLLCGCMSYEGFVRVDELKGRVLALEKEAAAKIVLAEKGGLTVSEALEWVRYATQEVSKIKEEIRATQKTEDVGWPGLVGAVIASILGATGWVRAWRGPSHKITGVAK